MQWSTHCNANTAIVRWTLREHGIALAGPEPTALVDAYVLQQTARGYAKTFLPDLYSWTTFDTAWVQRYAVTTMCRILHTHTTGEVTSKRAALLWAAELLDPNGPR